MNAYELAKYLENDFQIQEAVIDMLREQADKIRVYEQALQAIANDYHELSEHKIEVQVRNHKKRAREALKWTN